VNEVMNGIFVAGIVSAVSSVTFFPDSHPPYPVCLQKQVSVGL